LSTLQNTFRCTAASHSGPFDSPIGMNVKTICGWVKSNPGAQISYTKALNEFDAMGTAKYRTPQTPVVPGTISTLSFTLEEMSTTSNATVSLAQARASNAEFDQTNGELGTYSQEFEFDNQGTENLSPISVSA
jgi:hypothetical protein